jgi:hypothetical protein
VAARSGLVGALLLIALLLVGCGRDGRDGHADASPTAAATTTAASPSPAPADGPTQVSVTFEASCRVDPAGKTEVEIRYTARTQGEAILSRVRLIVNGREFEDSGPLSQREYRRIATVPGQPGQTYVYQIVAEAEGAQPPRFQSIVQCPQPPTPTGPRI